jgi:hypothetical protein
LAVMAYWLGLVSSHWLTLLDMDSRNDDTGYNEGQGKTRQWFSVTIALLYIFDPLGEFTYSDLGRAGVRNRIKSI